MSSNTAPNFFNGDGKIIFSIDSFPFKYDFQGDRVTVQADGKILEAGTSDGGFGFALTRYNRDGSLDTGFSGDGKVTTDLGSLTFNYGTSVTVQADGKILVAGASDRNFALVRYNSDGSLDSSFSGDGKVATDFGFFDSASSVTVQGNGKILVAGSGSSGGDFAVARYNSDGSLDTGFSGDGKVTTDFGSYDFGHSVTVQADGKILVAGVVTGVSDSDFALVRYNSDGSLDTGFSGDGKVTTDFGNDAQRGYSVTVQADGKILVAGESGGNFAVARYNSNGSLDTGFSGDGKVTTDFGNFDYGHSVTVQADGKILVAGISRFSSGEFFNAAVRYNADGSLDNTFESVNTLNGTARYTEKGAPAVLDSSVKIIDAELAAQGSYAGASITLMRHGGANSQDVFSGSGNLSFDSGNALLAGVIIGAVSSSNGALTITFNSNATQARVNAALSSLSYSNFSDHPPASVQIDWLFNDGNTGAQGAGGALKALGSTSVAIADLINNTAPTFFNGDGKVTTDFYSHYSVGNSIALQADGKIIVAGESGGNFAVARYNSDGSLDTGFSGDGKVTTAFGSFDSGNSVTVQADGKILVAGVSDRDFALVRYNADGSLDSGFSGDGKVTTDLGSNREGGGSVIVQVNGKILVAGTSNSYFALVRYNADGSLDRSFSGDGKVTTDLGPSYDSGHSVIVQPDGKILVAGGSALNEYGNYDFALVRYNADGSLDSSFSGDGIVTTDFRASSAVGKSVILQADGKIVVAGSGGEGFAVARYNADGSLDTSFDNDGKVSAGAGLFSGDFGVTFSNGLSATVQTDGKILVAGELNYGISDSDLLGGRADFALLRFNTDGSLDTGFSGDGIVITTLGYHDTAKSVTVQTDGKILVAGYSAEYNAFGESSAFALVRYNADGSLDNTFDPVNTLNGTARYTEKGAPAVLDSSVKIIDAELAAQGSYAGASVTLMRHGGANSQDVFSGSGNLSFGSGNALLSGVIIGAVSSSNGALTIHFNSNATQARVNAALSSLTYSNTSDHPPASVQIDWLFNDGNTGAQGAGGTLKTLGSKLVTITPINDRLGANTTPTFFSTGKVISDLEDSNAYWDSVTVQADGKILVAGSSGVYPNYDFALVRYNADGSRDTGFSGDGKVTTDFGGFDFGNSVTVQSNGKILVAGISDRDFALVRYNADGSMDMSFDGDGKVTTDFSNHRSNGNSVALQADGRILVAGYIILGDGTHKVALARYNSNGSLDTGFSGDGIVVSTTTVPYFFSSVSVATQADGKILVAGSSYDKGMGNFALERYNSNGSLDTGFSGDGKVTTDFGDNAEGHSITVQADGKIIVAGYSGVYPNQNFALVRYNSDGSLDTGFSGDGKVTTDFGDIDSGNSVTVQADGKILVAGSSGGNFAVARYNSDGSLDTGFSGDGKVTTDFGDIDSGNSITVQSNGKILVAGTRGIDNKQDFVMVRFNADGSLDNSFGVPVNTLDGAASFTENGPAVVLERTVQIFDAELDAQVSYSGASITLARHGGANSEDVFSGSGNLSFIGGSVVLSGVTIGNISNSNGALTIVFNDYASQPKVNTVLSSLTYSNTSANPPASVQIDWTFNDGNIGAQGTGGALKALGSTLVTITPVSDKTINYIDTVFDDSFATVTGKLIGSNADSSALTYGLIDGTDNGAGAVVKSSLFGVLTVIKATGAYSFVANDAAIEALTVNARIDFTITVSDGVLTDIKTLTVNITQANLYQTTESGGNDFLRGSIGNDKFDGLAGNDIIDGDWGADIMKGGLGNDLYIVDNAGDKVIETSTLATEIDRVNSSINYKLGANVENLVLTGTAAINGSGNTLNNILTGNTAANILTGGLGNDLYIVDNAGDKVIETSTLVTEIDRVNSSVNYKLGANVENLVLTGTAAINGSGNTLNNILTGNAAANILTGGLGNDLYIVDNAGDKVIETSTLVTEIDRVNSSVNYKLGANVENLVLTGTAAINGSGNTLNNILTGNTAANILDGGAGNDVLTGGAGNDVFRFTTFSKDTIRDFVAADDTVQLENSIFTKLTATGVLNSANFRTGPVAADANDYIIYNSNTDALFYDADGNGANAAVQIAVLGGNPALTFADFVVI